MSLNNENIGREISEDKIIAVCEKTACLRSGNFSDLNSSCSKVLVPVKIISVPRRGHSKRPIKRNLFSWFKPSSGLGQVFASLIGRLVLSANQCLPTLTKATFGL